jgi:outer membrane protein assembly factor BamB
MRRWAALLLIGSLGTVLAGDWPGWLGPNGDGFSSTAAPLRWSPTENVAWKIALPGVGHSSPIVVGERIFLTTYWAKGEQRLLLCLDRKSGKELWRSEVLTAPAEKMHRNNSPASATPVSDGKHVWTTFAEGENIVATCHDLSGKQVWQKKFGGWDSRHGFCGSPIKHENMIILNGDSDGDAFLAALDASTGATRWRIARPNKIRSFSVPIIVEVAGRPQLILAGSQSVVSHDPNTGKPFWHISTATQKYVATVAHADGVILASGTSPEPTLVGIDPTGKGDVTDSKILWSDPKGASYVPSPLAIGKHFLVVADNGLANWIEARSGKRVWTKRLGRAHEASPLLIGQHVYCVDTDGQTWILKAGTEFEVIAKNPLGEACHATPAVSQGQLFIRTEKHLWCIGSREKAKTN